MCNPRTRLTIKGISVWTLQDAWNYTTNWRELYEEHFADLIEKWKFLKQTIVPEVYEHEGRLEKKRKRARFERWISWTVAAIGLAIGVWGLFF